MSESGENVLVSHGVRVAELAEALGEARGGLERAAAGLVDVLKAEAWREFTGPGGELVLHEEFAEFVTADPPRGLGVSTGLVRALLADDPGALGLLEEANDTPPFEVTRVPAAALVAGEPLDVAEPVESDVFPPSEGLPDSGVLSDSPEPSVLEEPAPAEVKETPALRRLREEAPTLHRLVLAGELSTNAAMVQAGFRARTISVPVSRPESTAKALIKNLSREQLAELVTLLSADL